LRPCTFDRRDVLQAWAEHHRDGAPVRDLELLADAWLASPAAIQVEEQPADPECPLYSTPDMLEVEDGLVELATAQRDSGAGQVPDEDVADVLAARPELSEEQAELVRRLTRSGDGVEVVRAAAGTGKAYALAAARSAWAAGGYQVFGCALSARAAAELRDQSGIQTTTITRLLGDLDHGHTVGERAVLVVDEAGMVGTRAIAEIARHAAHAKTKLVLVGDDRQLPEIEAGGAFRGLAARLGAAELREVRRQRERWDRDALNALRGGDVAGWAQRYREHGRVVGAPDPEATRAALVSDWWRAHKEAPEKATMMIALRRVDVAELNARARACMRASGRLGDQELEAAGTLFASGDRVVAQRNDRRLGVTNGTLATVSAVDLERRSITANTDRGEKLELDSSYLDNGKLAHAYALTAHKAQGMTVDRAFVLGSDELYREWGYTALSRHRDEARFYVTAPADQPSLPGLEPPGDPVSDELNRTLGRSRAKDMAIDLQARGEKVDKSALRRSVAEAERFQRELASLQPKPDRAQTERDQAASERDAAEARLSETKRLREEAPWWSRGRRDQLDRQIEVQARAAEHWRSETERLSTSGLPTAPRSPSEAIEAPGAERLERQAVERTAIIEALEHREPVPAAIDMPPDDSGLEL
jgi:Ti-type conjugative transfer relaxase TraA